MKLLILSFFFPPDLAAGSFRSNSLSRALLSNLPKNSTIEIITTQPNRYKSYNKDAKKFEAHNGLTIYRVQTPEHNSGAVGQVKAFAVYAFTVHNLVKNKHYDLIFATSSRLMTAALGAYISRRSKIPLYLDIRDIFPDTVKHLFSKELGPILNKVFSFIEAFTIKSATKVNLVSNGFLPYFRERYPKQTYTVFTNGIDPEFVYSGQNYRKKLKNKKLTVVYAGNIGDGQGLHRIIPNLAVSYKDRLVFKIIGDGSRKRELQSALEASCIKNVLISNPIERSKLMNVYQSADILFLHLNDYGAFKKVLPSKLFEYAASGKPIWAGVSGYAREFIDQYIENAAVFSPCDEKRAIISFESLEIVTKPRTKFVEKFTRDQIMNEMSQDIIELIQ